MLESKHEEKKLTRDRFIQNAAVEIFTSQIMIVTSPSAAAADLPSDPYQHAAAEAARLWQAVETRLALLNHREGRGQAVEAHPVALVTSNRGE